MNLSLVIGNQNYSSWSLRPWLLLKAFDVHFEEIKESLQSDGLRERLLKHSPTAKVPVLFEQEACIWDSLAICEYINDVHLDGTGWPHSPIERAKARAVTCEMHSGFFALRGAMPMNVRARRQVDMTDDIQKDINRIEQIWANHHRSGWLFETFSIADCFYAPVAFRFQTYGVELNDKASQYMHKLLSHPAVELWVEASKAEDETLWVDEVGEER